MTNVIKVIKPGHKERSESETAKTSRQVTRELVQTVKEWISESEERRRAEQRSLSLLK